MLNPIARSPRYRRIPLHKRPRGIAVVMVLGLLAMTLAISYATLRGQGTTSQLARNNGRALDARAAAQSGLAAAVRKISENAWGGIDSTLRSNVTGNSWYEVAFETGDTKLLSGDLLYSEWPFRVTITATGYASDPLNANVRSEHKSKCVLQLVRKQLGAEPANWATMTGNTIYQYRSNKDAEVQFPVRINGSATLLGKLQFASDYPNNSTALNQYAGDLNLRRLAGLGDYRPLPSTLALKGLLTNQDLSTLTLLTLKMGIVAAEPLVSAAPPSHPGLIMNYRLYPGGKLYNTTPLSGTLQTVTLAPDVKTNPLGIYRSTGSLVLSNNVSITGTIITENAGSADIQVSGTSVVVRPFNLPALYGTNQIYQLPTAIIADDLKVNAASDSQFLGTTIVMDECEVKNDHGSTATKLSWTGNLTTSVLKLRGRSTWKLTGALWGSDKTAFSAQFAQLYFPDYQQAVRGFTVKPTLTFSPDSSGVKPHWHDWTQAVFQADPGDPGLQWEVVRWEDNL
jgi:hypothetical protein